MALKDESGTLLEPSGDLGLNVEPVDPFDIPAPPAKTVPTSKESAENIEKRVAEKRTAKPRVTNKGKAPAPAKPEKPIKADYTADAQSFVGNIWLGLAIIPPTQPYAAVFASNSDQLAASLAEGAKHNATIRNMLDGGTEHLWVVGIAGCVMQMGMQCMQVMRDPELKEEYRAATKATLSAVAQANGIQVPEAA